MKNFLGFLFLVLVTGLFFSYMLFMWATGCGEHYIDSKGVLHSYECYDLTSTK